MIKIVSSKYNLLTKYSILIKVVRVWGWNTKIKITTVVEISTL